MLLLTGPPGVGKGQQVLDMVRRALRRGAADLCLLVPTATMAEHLRHQLAREGLLLRPSSIETLSRFIEPWASDLPEVTAAQLELVVEEALDRAVPRDFTRVAHLPGFRACLARLIDEIATAGCDPHRLATLLEGNSDAVPFGSAVQDVYQRTQEELNRRGWALPANRVHRAAEQIRDRGLGGIRQVILDGFFTFSEPELDLINAIRQHAELTVTLPRWRGAEAARVSLLALGLPERTVAGPARPRARTALFTAPGLDQEAEEIARRILVEAAAGREFREIGVVVRGRQPYVPVLRAVFERFGIPARFYFADPLAEHPVARYLAMVIEAMLAGWDHEKTLAATRMAPAGAGVNGAGDRFEFAARERLPGRGLAGLKALAPSVSLRALLDRFALMDPWRGGTAPPEEWAARARNLRTLVRPPIITDGVDHETAGLWRSRAAALDAFDAALDEAALALPRRQPVTFAVFWRALGSVLKETRLRVRDQRRNVVHVMDVYEARQWDLPVVFLCGLLEREFPLYAAPDPILSDAARAALERLGVRLRTTAGRQLEEEFLFDLAITRASSDLVLSYPEANDRGDPNLPSFFLRKLPMAAGKAQPVRPQAAGGPFPRRAAAQIQSPDLLERLRAQHAVLKPTALEQFLDCPFQFFAGHTLKLEEPPARPEERLDAGAMGAVVHRVLAEWYRSREPLEPLFERVFEEVLDLRHIPPGCAAELARLSMLRDLRRFLEDPLLKPDWTVATERPVQFPLGEGFQVRGRIDRFDVGPAQQAVVFDFKYSAANAIRERVRRYERGELVQAGLYLLGLEHLLGVTAAGMFYCGLRGEVRLDGWHAGLSGFPRNCTACTAGDFRERLDRTRAVALATAREIQAGRIGPRENDRCEYCAFHDLCRLRPAAEAAAAGGAD